MQKNNYLAALQKKHHDKIDREDGWKSNQTVDYWRHSRMYALLSPILKKYVKAKWLTVGDGRYGHEANYINSAGSYATASDISTTRLSVAKKSGYISNYLRLNAEKMKLQDNAYDFVLCKESYHHFARPSLAVYEMLRVAKRAVILIEPNDVVRRGLSWMQLWGVEDTSSYLNKFEISGNYVYSLSRREVQKFALGIGLSQVSFSSIDDCYYPGVEQEMVADNGPLFRRIKRKLMFADLLYKLGVRDRSILVSIIWKIQPTKSVNNILNEYGYINHQLPKNPYL